MKNTKPIAPIRAGEIVAFTTGEYSDYSVIVLFRAKSDFTNDDMNKALVDSECMRMSEPFQLTDGTWSKPEDRFDEDKLIAYLAKLDCFEEIRAREIHLGDYGRFDLVEYGNLGW